MAKKQKKQAPKLQVTGALPKVKISMPLDAKQIEAIKRCLAKGRLELTMTNVDLAKGRLGEGWLYD